MEPGGARAEAPGRASGDRAGVRAREMAGWVRWLSIRVVRGSIRRRTGKVEDAVRPSVPERFQFLDHRGDGRRSRCGCVITGDRGVGERGSAAESASGGGRVREKAREEKDPAEWIARARSRVAAREGSEPSLARRDSFFARTWNRGGGPPKERDGKFEDDPGDGPRGEEPENLRVLFERGSAGGGQPALLDRRALLGVVVALLGPVERGREHLRFGGKFADRVKMTVKARAGKLRAQHLGAALVVLHLEDDLVSGLFQPVAGFDQESGGGQRGSRRPKGRARVGHRVREFLEMGGRRVKRAGRHARAPEIQAADAGEKRRDLHRDRAPSK